MSNYYFNKQNCKIIKLIPVIRQIKNSETYETEEIVCTPHHRIFVNGKWCEACNILAKDKVKLYNDVVGIVINKTTKKLNNIESTYNFEVEDYHTYYVGNIAILVHNDCTGSCEIEFSDRKKYRGKGSKKISSI